MKTKLTLLLIATVITTLFSACKATSKSLTTKTPSKTVIHVLDSLDLDKDVKKGVCTKQGEALVGMAQSVLETGIKLPEEYDIVWEFESQSTAVNLLLVSPIGKRFEYMVKGWSHRLTAIRNVDGKEANESDTTVEFPLDESRHKVTIKVRKDRFVATINDKLVLDYPTDWENIEITIPWHDVELNSHTLGLWFYKHWTKTYRLDMIPK